MLNRFYSSISSFSSSFFYRPMGHPSRRQPSAREKPALPGSYAHPGFSPPDSVPWWQAAPQSPRSLIGLPSARKATPAKGFFQSVPPPVCQQPWRPLSRRTRRCHCGRQGRRVTPVGFGSLLVGGSGGRVFEVGRGEWQEGQAGGAGAGGELRRKSASHQNWAIWQLLQIWWLAPFAPFALLLFCLLLFCSWPFRPSAIRLMRWTRCES